MPSDFSIPVCPLISSGERVFVLCEKPSVARDLGGVLGCGGDRGGFFSYSGGVVSWAYGHLLVQADPGEYRKDWVSWVWEVLPMVPEGFCFKSVVRREEDAGRRKKIESHLVLLKRLYLEADVLVNACDAGREGELIWWEIMRYCGWGEGLAPGVPGSKKALRFWAQSNTAEGLREAWEAMRPVGERLGLAEAAYCRSEGDWLLGMNLSRAATLSFPRKDEDGKRTVWSVGRVQTPVLAMITARDREISNFVPRPFYEVRIEFSCEEPFEGVLLVPKGVEPFVPEGGLEKEPKGFLRKEDARAALERVLATAPNPWTVEDEEKAGLENAPALFSLTDLQKWCNRVWGWEAGRTLKAAQEAYEVDKTLTYPRTDSCFLPRDAMEKMDAVHSSLVAEFLSGRVVLPDWVRPPSLSSRASHVFDDSKLTDHYAIVPTGVVPGNLESDSGKVWLAVLKRFIVAFGPPARYVSVKRRCTFGNDVAVAGGKRYEDLGWIRADNVLAPLVGEECRKDPRSLGINPGRAPVSGGRLHEGKTTPPKPFTEASLLSVMENVHTKLDSEEETLKEAIAGKGLGTPATRAAIIDLLVERGYVNRVKKGGAPLLRATTSGFSLIDNLCSEKLDFLTRPDLTAEWESFLSGMERGETGGRLVFLEGLLSEVKEAVEVLRKRASVSQEPGVFKPRVELGEVCPLSGKPVADFGTFWEFPGFPGRVPKVIAGRQFSVDEICQVLAGAGPVFEGFVSKKGNRFAASLKPDFESGRFSFVFPEKEIVEAGVCPVTGRPIEDHGSFWKFPGREEVFWKKVSGKDIPLSVYCKLVEEGRSGLVDGFVSKKGSKFSAFLVIRDGKVSFDFSGVSGPVSPGMKGPGSGKKSSYGGSGKKKF